MASTGIGRKTRTISSVYELWCDDGRYPKLLFEPAGMCLWFAAVDQAISLMRKLIAASTAASDPALTEPIPGTEAVYSPLEVEMELV